LGLLFINTNKIPINAREVAMMPQRGNTIGTYFDLRNK
jgi:hypothetical protein